MIEPIRHRLHDLLALKRAEEQAAGRDVNISELARACKVTPQAAEQWFAIGDRQTMPRRKYYSEIANFFGINERDLEYPENPNIPSDSVQIASLCEQLSPSGRKLALSIVKTIFEQRVGVPTKGVEHAARDLQSKANMGTKNGTRRKAGALPKS